MTILRSAQGPQAHLKDGKIVLGNTAFRDRDSCKALFGSRYANGQWSLPATWAAVKQVRETWPDIEIDQGLIDWCWQEFNGRVQPTMVARTLALDPNDRIASRLLHPALYGYQTTGASFLKHALGATLGDDPGTGKCATAIAAAELTSAYPVLVTCPSTAKVTWAREWAKWAPNRTVQVVYGSAGQRRRQLTAKADVYVVGMQSLRTHTRLAPYGSTRLSEEDKRLKELNSIDFATVIVDEAHRIVDPNAKQTRAAWGSAPHAANHWALTGTPIVNYPGDLWSLLHFSDPLEWPTKTKYIDRYVKVEVNYHGYPEYKGLLPEHADEFYGLVQPRLLRRPKALVLPWLPDKIWTRREVELPPKQRKTYDDLRDNGVAMLSAGPLVATNVLTTVTRLTQAASSALDLDAQGNVRLVPPSPKIEALVELLEDIGDEQLIVFAMSRQLIDMASERLTKEGISHGSVTGEQSELARQNEVDAFQSGRSRVILCTFGAGSEAITLTAASTVCFLQRSWSMVANRQAEDRPHRPGQTADKIVYVDIVARNTIDERILDVLEEKDDMAEEILQDKVLLRRLLGD